MAYSDEDSNWGRRTPELHPSLKKTCNDCKHKVPYLIGMSYEGGFQHCDKYPDARIPLGGFCCDEFEQKPILKEPEFLHRRKSCYTDFGKIRFYQ